MPSDPCVVAPSRPPLPRIPPTRWRQRLLAAVLAPLLLAVSACADGGDGSGMASLSSAAPSSSIAVDGGSDGAGTSEGDGEGEAPEPAYERWTGSDDDFYVVPDPLPPGEPGQLIRVQDLGETEGYVDLRVMYHSRDANDQDRAVTGIISYPTAEPPADGWPVIALAHGTTGLASQCAPSRAGDGAPGFGIEGVRVATDYVGLGPVGEVHPYLSGLSEAQPVIDSVRAARQLDDAGAGERWLAIGHSQGGHAALFTHEIAADYAPELEHLGTVVSAPAAALDRRFGPDDEVVPRMVGVMALYGIAQDNPQLDPDDYAGAELRANADIVTSGCTQDVIDAFVTIPSDELYDTDPLDDPEAREVIRANEPGTVATDVPMLVLYGELDWWVVPDRVRFVFDRLCDVGQQAQLVNVASGDHGNLLEEGGAVITDWFEARLAGEPAPDSCEVP